MIKSAFRASALVGAMHLLCWQLDPVGGYAFAEEWLIEPDVATGFRYSDNINLNGAGNSTSAMVWTVTPSVRASASSEIGSMDLGYRLNSNNYLTGNNRDTIDHALLANARWGDERDSLDLAGSLLRDSTLNSELASTGVVTARRQRTQTAIKPSIRRELDEGTQIALGGTYTQTRYQPGPGLVDSNEYGGSLALTHQWSERLTLGLTGAYSRFQSDPPSQTRNRTVSTSLTATWLASERLKIEGDAGIQRSSISRDGFFPQCLGGAFAVNECERAGVPVDLIPIHTSFNDTGFSGHLQAVWRGLSDDWTFSASRAGNSTGTGAVVRTERGDAQWLHRFDERLSCTARLAALRSRYLDDSAKDARYLTALGSLQWQVAPQWYASGGVSYQRTQGQGAAQAREVFVSLSYRFEPLRSRR